MTKEITDSEFQGAVLENTRPTLVYFSAVWCGPCRLLGPVVEELAAKHTDIDVVKMDVDANPQVSQALNIMSIPTLAYFVPGQQPKGLVGFRPLAQIEEALGL